MVVLKTLPLLAALVAVSALAAPKKEPLSLGKRDAVLDARQTCRTAGWIPACPGPFSCVPPGAVCCSDGYTYVMPPDTCPDGTDAIATAGVSPPPSVPSSPPVVTRPPPVVSKEYTWYTYTITWYYYHYYYTYIDFTSTTLGSKEVTTYSTISCSATDEAAASSYFAGFTATAAYPTPTQMATEVSGGVPSQTYPVKTSTSAYEAPQSSSVPSYDNRTVSVTKPASPPATSGPATAGAGRTFGSGWSSGGLTGMIGAAALGGLVGVVMVVL